MNNKVRFGYILAHIGVDYNVADKCIATAVQLQSQVMRQRSFKENEAFMEFDHRRFSSGRWAVGSRRTAGEGGRQREKAVWEGKKERVMVFFLTFKDFGRLYDRTTAQIMNTLPCILPLKFIN